MSIILYYYIYTSSQLRTQDQYQCVFTTTSLESGNTIRVQYLDITGAVVSIAAYRTAAVGQIPTRANLCDEHRCFSRVWVFSMYIFTNYVYQLSSPQYNLCLVWVRWRCVFSPRIFIYIYLFHISWCPRLCLRRIKLRVYLYKLFSVWA